MLRTAIVCLLGILALTPCADAQMSMSPTAVYMNDPAKSNGASLSPATVTVKALYVTNDGTVGSTLTVQGSAFSVGGSNLSVDANQASTSKPFTVSSTLTVQGVGDATGLTVGVDGANRPQITMSDLGNGTLVGIRATASKDLQIDPNGASIVAAHFDHGGNVGIGTTSPLAKLTNAGDLSQVGPSTFHATITLVGTSLSQPMFMLHDLGAASNPGLEIQNDVEGWQLQTVGARNNAFEIFDATCGGAASCTVERLETHANGSGVNFLGPVTVSASSITVVGAAQFGGVAASSFSAAGYYIPTGWTSTQLSPAGAAPAPDKIGEETRNTTINDMCISTGTSAGNWALVGSKGATGCF